MASECGWSHKYIFKNFTLQQAQRYYELIQKKKMQALQLQTISTLKAVGYAFGSIKKKDFMKFINSLDMKKETLENSFERMKKLGYNVEDK